VREGGGREWRVLFGRGGGDWRVPFGRRRGGGWMEAVTPGLSTAAGRAGFVTVGVTISGVHSCHQCL